MVDHYLVTGTRKVNAWRLLQGNEKILETGLMNKCNKAGLSSGLAPIDWMQIFSDLNFDPNWMTDAFHEIFGSALNSYSAMKKRNVRTEKPLS